MSFDGIFINQLVKEIQPQLVGARIDKIHQPEKDELSIQIRGRQGNVTLFLSVESSMPYFTLTKHKKENPAAPPMFCMLMRKHIAGGKILDVEQRGYERVVVFTIEAKNELSEIETKQLIVEIMGKHSNIVLTREDGTIIDSIKRITPDMSRVRTVLPGLTFDFLPSDKCTLEADFKPYFAKLEGDTPIFKALYMTYEGMSPQLSRYLLRKANIPHTQPIRALSEAEGHHLRFALSKLLEKLASETTNGYLFHVTEQKKNFSFLKDLMLDTPVTETPSLCALLDLYYSRVNQELKIHQRTQNLKKTLQQRIERYETKIKKMNIERAESENADAFKEKGELILANLHNIQRGDNKVRVLNYYLDPPEDEDILLDLRLEPSQNAQSYFKKYNKLKTAQTALAVQIKETQAEIDYLEQALTHLENSEDAATVDAIRQELAEQGIIKSRYQQKKGKKTVKNDFRTFESSDGYEILVGKNNVQNDQLTLKLASNKDIWLHTKIIPGSHVIVRTQGETPPETTIEEAATIAAYFSKARLSSNVPVDYTLVKNVSKPSGAKPGMVIYVKNRTVFVTPKLEVIEQLKKD